MGRRSQHRAAVSERKLFETVSSGLVALVNLRVAVKKSRIPAQLAQKWSMLREDFASLSVRMSRLLQQWSGHEDED